MNKNLTLSVLLALLASMLPTFSLAPFGFWPLAIVSLVLFHLALKGLSAKQSFYLAWLFNTCLLLVGAHWVYVSIHDHGGTDAVLAALITLVFCTFVGSWLAPLIWFYKRFIETSLVGASLGFSAIWLINEWLRTWFLTGFPWLFLGYSQQAGPLSGLAPIIGTLGIGFVLAFMAALISLVIQKRQSAALLIIIPMIFMAVWPFNGKQWTQKKSDKAYTVALVQGNVTLENKWDPVLLQPMINYYKFKIAQYADSDIIVLPETAIPEYLHRLNAWFDDVNQILKPHQSALIFGALAAEFEPDNIAIYNSLATAGDAYGRHYKQKLVPFGEFVPLEGLIRGLIPFFDLPMSSFAKGSSDQAPLRVKDIFVQPFICYEVVYPDFVSTLAANADVLLTVSNDAWFGRSIGPIQHLQMAQMRALETGRYMMRATNDGRTVIINQNGQITARIAPFKQGVLTGEVYAYQGLTPIMRYGSAPWVIFSLLLLLCLAIKKPHSID